MEDVLFSDQHPRDILLKARSVLQHPQRWTQKAIARDSAGRPVRPNSPQAVCWCLEGAIAAACNEPGVLPYFFQKLLDGIANTQFASLIHEYIAFGSEEEPGPIGAGEFQDWFDHATMLRLLDAAIQQLEET